MNAQAYHRPRRRSASSSQARRVLVLEDATQVVGSP